MNEIEVSDGASHVDIRRKSGQGRWNGNYKGPEVLRYACHVQGTTRGQGGWSSVGLRGEGKEKSEGYGGRGGPESILRTSAFPVGQMESQWMTEQRRHVI